jgi:cell division protein FtsL
MSIPAHLKYSFLAILLIGASINTLSTTHKIMQSSKRLGESKEEVLSLKSEKKELEEQVEYKKTQGFVEETAREKLNMILPNEEVYIYPEDQKEEPQIKKRNQSADTFGDEKQSPVVKTAEKEEIRKVHLTEWKNLLF